MPIKFPETAATEWQIVADAANASTLLRQRLERDLHVEGALEKLRIKHEAQMQFEAELQAANTPDLHRMTLAEYLANPPPQASTDLIDGVIHNNSVCSFVGPSRAGKTTLALQACYCLATGEPFLDQPVQRIAGGIGIISYDMPTDKMFDWMSGLPHIDPRKFDVVDAYNRGNPLAVPEQRTTIANLWRSMNTEVVVVDSFSASFFGQDQNDTAGVQNHYRELKQFAMTEVGARLLIIIVHSTEGSPRKPRNSSVHMDAVDSMLVVWPPDGPGTPRHVDMEKGRPARGQVLMTSRVLTSPDPVTNLVDCDPGGMQVAGYPLPQGLVASMFSDVPDVNSTPDLNGDSPLEESEDL